jgi:hypothetical protein
MLINPNIKIIGKKNDEKERFYCQLCKYPLITYHDFRLNREFECCLDCYLTFIEGRKNEWKKGWRPKQEVVDNYIKDKRHLYENNLKEVK